MPYIERPRGDLDPTSYREAETPGELNYQFSTLADDYLTRKGLSYQHINDVIGALEAAKLELYRRVASPYEDIKCARNGEVYTSVPHER